MTALEFNTYILKMGDLLRNYARVLTSDKEDANDLFQETYLKALLNREKLTDHSNLKAWLYTIMRNIFINNYRRTYKSNVKFDKSDTPDLWRESNEDMFINGDIEFSVNEIQSEIMKLQPELRDSFMMHLSGYKYKEIAEDQGIVIGTVKSRIFNARQQLMEQLKDYVN